MEPGSDGYKMVVPNNALYKRPAFWLSWPLGFRVLGEFQGGFRFRYCLRRLFGVGPWGLWGSVPISARLQAEISPLMCLSLIMCRND